MKKKKNTVWGGRALLGIMALVFSVILGMCVEQFSIVSLAQSQSKVIANSAKIRQDASTSSEALASVEKGDSLTINHQVTGSDGKIWYQVFVNANTLGFIRSDLVEITDGSTPPTMEANTTNTSQTTNTDSGTTTANDTPAKVTAVNPISAKASAESVRVRANASASTGSQIVANIQRGFALTVTGTADGSDGNVWYQVNFMSDNTEVTGFVRSDFVDLEGELTPYTDAPAQEPDSEPQEPADGAAPAVTEKMWDTQQEGDKWYLLNRETEKKYPIQSFFDLEKSAKELEQLYEDQYSQNKTQKMIVIMLVFLLVVMAGAITFLIFKVRDLKDASYFEEMDREPVRRRTADRPAGMGQNGNHNNSGRGSARPGNPDQRGASRPAQGSKPRSAGQSSTRPAGQGSTRPSGQGNARPAGAGQSSARPAGQGSARPSGQGSARPNGAGQSGARPSGQGSARPAGAGQSGARPLGQGNVRPVGAPQNGNRRPTSQEAERPVQGQRNRARNFANEDDEFEFEFLNWDGVDE